MLRAAVEEGTEVGKVAGEAMEKGELVEDSVITEIVLERLKQEDVKEKGYLLDGFPRTGAQARALNEACADAESGILTPDVFLLLEVERGTLVERVAGRRNDPETGTIYHMTFDPPTDPEVIERLVQRADDTEEAIGVRVDTFHANVGEILGEFEGKVARVDGNSEPAEISQSVREASRQSNGNTPEPNPLSLLSQVLAAVKEAVDPTHPPATVSVCFSKNNNLAVTVDAPPPAEGGEEKKEEATAAEEEVPAPDPEVAGAEPPEEQEELATPTPVVTNRTPPLPPYCAYSTVSIAPYPADPTVPAIVARIPSSSSSLSKTFTFSVPPASAGLFTVTPKAPFGCTLLATSDGEVRARCGTSSAPAPTNSTRAGHARSRRGRLPSRWRPRRH
jgi:adenylate kinase